MNDLKGLLDAATAFLMAAAALVGVVTTLVVKARREIAEFKRELRMRGMDSALRNTPMTADKARALRDKGKV